MGDYGLSTPTGPLSPAQLAELERVLTPVEQAAVSAWQSTQAEAALAAERARGGPRSEEVSVTPQGAVIRAVRQQQQQVQWSTGKKVGLIAALGLAALIGGYALSRRGVRR